MPGQVPKRFYRFFESEKFAQDLVDGKVWLSTLGYLRTCRRNRGDTQ